MPEHFIATYKTGKWELCLAAAKIIADKHDSKLLEMARHHHQSGRYIDAHADQQTLMACLRSIERWSYCNIPAARYDELCGVIGFEPRTTLNHF